MYIKVLQQNAYVLSPLGWQDIPSEAYDSLLLDIVQGKTDINTALQHFSARPGRAGQGEEFALVPRYRAAIIGCGGIALWHARGYRAQPDVDLIACADISAEALQRFGDEFGIAGRYLALDEMLDRERPGHRVGLHARDAPCRRWSWRRQVWTARHPLREAHRPHSARRLTP